MYLVIIHALRTINDNSIHSLELTVKDTTVMNISLGKQLGVSQAGLAESCVLGDMDQKSEVVSLNDEY